MSDPQCTLCIVLLNCVLYTCDGVTTSIRCILLQIKVMRICVSLLKCVLYTCDGVATSIRCILLQVEVLSILGAKLVLDVALPGNACLINCHCRGCPSNVSCHLHTTHSHSTVSYIKPTVTNCHLPTTCSHLAVTMEHRHNPQCCAKDMPLARKPFQASL